MTLGNQIGAHLFFKYYTGFGFTQRTGSTCSANRS